MRTFIQKGQGYGSNPVTIVAKIDGNIVFSGTVDTVDQPLPALPQTGVNLGVNLFTWEKEYTFQGTQTMEVTVSGGTLLITDTLGNNEYDSSTFTAPYSETIDGITYYDPFTGETLNGVALEGPPQNTLPGQWYWTIPAGGVFSATVNILSAAITFVPWNDAKTWNVGMYVTNDGLKYVSLQAVPIGIAITDTAYWELLV
jgi:hypothetical protein